jgi:hypothetical protein
MMLLPMARTPMDKSSSAALQKYSKKMVEMLDGMVPWQVGKKQRGRRRAMANVTPGETVVVLDAGDDADHPLFTDAKLTRG